MVVVAAEAMVGATAVVVVRAVEIGTAFEVVPVTVVVVGVLVVGVGGVGAGA